MSQELTDPAPAFCDESTHLLPFFRQAVERAVFSGQPFFVSVTIETSYSDPLAILEEIHRANEPICYLERPSNEFSIACAEFVTEASFDGPERFKQAKAWGESVFTTTLIAGDHHNPGTGPTLFMAATFEDEPGGKSSPPALQVFLPRWQVLRKGGSHFVIINASVDDQSDPVRLTEEFANAVKRIKDMPPDAAKPKETTLVELGQPEEEFDYESAVGQALEHIRSGQISKVVLARKLTYGTSNPLNPFSIAHDLRERFPECFTFCLSTPGQGIMVGATPETLAKISGVSLETEALAGSAPRGLSAGKDAHWGKTLLAREKEATATPPTTSSAATEAQATHAHSGSLPKISSSWACTPDEEVPLTPAALPSSVKPPSASKVVRRTNAFASPKQLRNTPTCEEGRHLRTLHSPASPPPSPPPLPSPRAPPLHRREAANAPNLHRRWAVLRHAATSHSPS